jgi:RNA polymerase sigma factor (TIGR02999 family)
MDAPGREDVTRLLDSGRAGATDELLPLVYDELKALARAHLSREAGGGRGMTLQATALVHEAYLRLVGGDEVRWNSRGHFFAAAARAMRRILVERARRVATPKHGGGKVVRGEAGLALAAATPSPEDPGVDVLALDGALGRLESVDPRRAEIVLLRYFAGLSVEQTAAVMALSERTVKNEWAYARAWRRRELETAPGAAPGPAL